jgi:hypothetical protein
VHSPASVSRCIDNGYVWRQQPAAPPRSERRSNEDPVDDKIKQLLKDLGSAINESISSSEDVNERIQKIRDEGYNLYVVLDATIGLNREGEEPPESQGAPGTGELEVKSSTEVQFRINVNDLNLLRSLGIDPTRKVRSLKRIEPLTQQASDDAENN